jgi:Protein of unknown function (DUF3035)
MRNVIVSGALLGLLSACGSSSGVFGRDRPDEFAVSRAAPLVVPPDFALTPPAPGAPRPQEADSSTQALQAMFGGPAARSAAEGAAVSQAGATRSQAGIRSDAGDPGTTVVDKGSVTRDIIAAPEGDGAEAKASTPQ